MAFDYDLTDLRLIVNIFDTASLTRGSERSCMSPPAASARLKKVQESLRTQLFYRTTQGLVPTSAGHNFVRHARAVLQQLDHLDSEFREREGEFAGCIRLFANTLSLGESIPAVIETFLLTHPGMNIDLHERPSAEITRALKQGLADVGILTSEVPDEGLIYRAYRTERLVLVAPRDHPMATLSAVEFAETLQFDYVGMSEHAALQAFLKRMASSEGIPMKLRIQTTNYESLCRLVESGIGVGIIPHTVAVLHEKNMKFVTVRLSNAWAERELKIAVRSTASLTPPAIALIEALSGGA
ncbi:LysR substrate-binding domain-containing protein [Cupriavidus sp. CP313]